MRVTPRGTRIRREICYDYLNEKEKGGSPLTLEEVASELAGRMECDVLPIVHPAGVILQGKGYQVVVSSFFGGWQAILKLPDKPPLSYYGETAGMLETRLKAKLTGRESQF